MEPLNPNKDINKEVETDNVLDDAPPVDLQTKYAAFEKYFGELKIGREILKGDAIKGKLRKYPLRSICWKVFLRAVDTDDPANWIQQLAKHREAYAKLKARHVVDPHAESQNQVFDPLSQNENSPWNKYFENTKLEKLINQDILRTYPELDFFQGEFVQKTMLQVLFIYAKEHEETRYKQGMHELLAPMVYICEREKMPVNLHPVLGPLLDDRYVENDCFIIFDALMKMTGKWFVTGKDKGGVDQNSEPPEDSLSPIIKKLRFIQSTLLKQHDPQLYNYLDNLGIEPQFYALRWVRLLFAREFHLEDAMVLWDAIFSNDEELGLIDYIAVSMLMYLREQLLLADYSGCLRRLLKYPPVESVNIFIENALSMRSPKGQPLFAIRNIVRESPLGPVGGLPTTPVSDDKRHTSAAPSKTPKHKPSVRKPPKDVPRHKTLKESIKTTLKNAMYVDDFEQVVSDLRAQVGAHKSTHGRVARRLEDIVLCLQKEVLEREFNTQLVDSVYLAVAELKRIKDVLNGLLPPDMLIEMFSYTSDNARKPPTTNTPPTLATRTPEANTQTTNAANTSTKLTEPQTQNNHTPLKNTPNVQKTSSPSPSQGDSNMDPLGVGELIS